MVPPKHMAPIEPVSQGQRMVPVSRRLLIPKLGHRILPSLPASSRLPHAGAIEKYSSGGDFSPHRYRQSKMQIRHFGFCRWEASFGIHYISEPILRSKKIFRASCDTAHSAVIKKSRGSALYKDII